MNNDIFIVVYKNGTMMPLANEPRKIEHQEGARFFKADENTTLLDLSEFYGRMLKSSKFEEIEGLD